jgi:hypothetical protein
MTPPDALSLYAALALVVGVLCLTFGLGPLLSRLVPTWAPAIADVGPAAFHNPGPPSSPSAYQAVVLVPAGRFGNYWQEVGRCGHQHPHIWAAWDCACLPPVAGLAEGATVGVAVADA